jgi:hypothetical protein
MPFHIRCRGKGYGLRIKHRLLDKPFYATCSSGEEAERVAATALAELDQARCPAGGSAPARKPVRFASPRRSATTAPGDVGPASTRRLLDTIANEIGATMLSDIDYIWAES